MTAKLYVQIGERERTVEIEERDGQLRVSVDGEPRDAELIDVGDGLTYALRLGDRVWEIMGRAAPSALALLASGEAFEAAVRDEREQRLAEAAPAGARHQGQSEIRAPMPGLVVSVAVAPGDTVAPETRLLSLEAMKMENEIRAPGGGTVAEVRVSAGQKVEQGQVLVVIE